jgi:hypothetical protein
MMRLLLAATAIAIASPAWAGPAEDATAAVTTSLDKFNAGDIPAFLEGHRDGALIVDEFAPFLWGGSNSAQRWLEDYGKDTSARGITGGRVDYGKPIQAVSDGKSAYIVMPATYSFMQNGVKMAGSGSMTFVMGRTGGEWKISSWTYSGATASPQR